MATKLELTQAKLIGFSLSSNGYSIWELARTLGIKKAEWLKIRLTSNLSLQEINELDSYFEKSIANTNYNRYCKIIFSQNDILLKGYKTEELHIFDKLTLDKIFKLGFIEEEMIQSFDFRELVSYRCSLPIFFKENDSNKNEYKNKTKAISIVEKLCLLKKFKIDEDLNCFSFYFPASMFN